MTQYLSQQVLLRVANATDEQRLDVLKVRFS